MLKCGHVGGGDLSLIGLFTYSMQSRVSHDKALFSFDFSPFSDADSLLLQLEHNDLQLGVVSFDELLDYASHRTRTSVQIIGPLLGGDCRALVSMTHCDLSDHAKSSKVNSAKDFRRRKLGAQHPASARARWEEISCAFDIDCFYDDAEKISALRIADAMVQGRYAVLECNLFWEGMFGLHRGLVSQVARASDYGIPTAPSHILVSNQKALSETGGLMKELRLHLSEIYQIFISNSEHFVEVFSEFERKQSADPIRPRREFLQASARILAPHCEEFLRSNGRLDRLMLEKYLRWFNARVLGERYNVKPVYAGAGSLLEQMLCDKWE